MAHQLFNDRGAFHDELTIPLLVVPCTSSLPKPCTRFMSALFPISKEHLAEEKSRLTVHKVLYNITSFGHQGTTEN